MNALRTLKLSAATVAALAITAGSQSALAQTAPVTATVTVQNTVTLNVSQNMNYGTLALVPGAASPADDVVANLSTAGVVSVTPAGGGAGSVVDNTAAAEAIIEVTNFADGATINIDIQAVVDPTDGGTTLAFTAAGWLASWNGGADSTETAGTPWTQVLDAAFNGGTNTLVLGSEITSLGATTNADGVYSGSFNVVFSY